MTQLVWGAFLAFFACLLVLDLSVLHRRPAEVSIGQALFWTLFWVSVALSFNLAVYGLYEYHWLAFRPGPGVAGGCDAVVQFITGYLLEWSLSVDNIFVIALIFTAFNIPQRFQHGVLFWGIVGAIALRGLMIVAGAALLRQFDWMYYVFGAVLLVSALRMLGDEEGERRDFRSGFAARLARRFMPVTEGVRGGRFFVREEGGLAATPLFIVLVVVEIADVVFAVDSIPAILAVTRDPFLVFTSNAFAILGLRSLYLAVSGLMAMFRYLRYSLVLILAFVGVKMLLVEQFHVANTVSLAIILVTLGVGILASMIVTRREAAGQGGPPQQ